MRYKYLDKKKSDIIQSKITKTALLGKVGVEFSEFYLLGNKS